MCRGRGPALAAAAVIYWIVRPGQSPNDLTGGPCKRALVTLVLSGLCAAAAAQIVESSIARPVVVQMGEPPIPLLVVGILAVAAVNSLGEELLWRGVLHDWLTCSVKMPTTVLATSASFGAAHLAGIPGGPGGVIAAAGMGIVLGVARVRLGLASCVIVHFVVDVAVFSSLAVVAVWVGSPAAWT